MAEWRMTAHNMKEAYRLYSAAESKAISAMLRLDLYIDADAVSFYNRAEAESKAARERLVIAAGLDGIRTPCAPC